MASARSTATVEVRTTHVGAEQGISRLAMLAFLRGEHGPWNGQEEPTKTQWVRYRGHHIERYVVPGEGRTLRLTYHDHTDSIRTEKFAVRTSGLAAIRDLDDLLDIVLAEHPLEDDEEIIDTSEPLGTFRTVEGVRLATLDEAGVYAVRLEGILRHVHDLVKRGASLDEIDAGLHAARSADQRPTIEDLADWERDAEREAKAEQRAAETDGGER